MFRRARLVILLAGIAGCAGFGEEPPARKIQALLEGSQYVGAEKATREWIAALESDHKAETLEYAGALDLLCEILGTRYAPVAQMQPLAERAIAIKTKLQGEGDVSIAKSLNIIGLRKYRMGDYAGAIVDFSKSTALEGPGAPFSLIVTTLNGYGLAIGGKGDPKTALPMHERALAICEKEFGADGWQTAETLFSLSTDYRQMGDLNRSLEYMNRSADIFEKSRPLDPATAQSIGGVASIYREQRKYKEAVPFFEKSIHIFEISFGPDNPRLVAVYNNYGLCLKSISDFTKAGVAMEKAVAISTKVNGPKSSITAQTLGNLAIIYQEEGDYPKAREAYERALSILEVTLGLEHEGTASVLTSLGLVLRDIGDTRAARPYLERALAVYEKRFGPENPKTLQLVSNLASVSLAEGNLKDARTLVERTLNTYTKTLGPDNLGTAAEKGSLAEILAKSGEIPQAVDLYRQAIATFDAKVGADSFGGAQARAQLAELELKMGREQEAMELSRQSVASFSRLFGADYPRLAATLAIQADAELKLGEVSKCFDDALDSARIRRRTLLSVARTVGERQALLFATKGGDGLDVALRLAAQGISPDQRIRLWDAVIRDRALVLDEMAERRRMARDQAVPELIGLNRSLILAREELANSVVAGPRVNEKDYSGRIDLLRAVVESKERQVAVISADFRHRLDSEHAGFGNVVAALSRGAALVAYVHYSGGYLAFVIQAGQLAPGIVALGADKRIDALVRGWRGQIDREREFQGHEAAKNETAYREAGGALRRAVWDPLATALAGAGDVYLTTDGTLQLVNFPALPTGKTSYLMETGPLLHLLSTERDLTEDSAGKSDGGMLAMGRPSFDAKVAPSNGAQPNQYRGAVSNCAGFGSLDFSDLPDSAREAQSVLRVWLARGNTGIALTGDKATKTAFEGLAAGKRVIHIATHGFFLGQSCSPQTALEDPLLRSGLALAGANRRSKAGPGEDDGILTAEEVASMDLSAAELVVLSGCDTGSGEIHAGEGVLGLRRAFRIAGARNLVMSLWPVTDEGALGWMSAFYQSRFGRQRSPAQAVRDASINQLRARRAAGLSTHPFYWAGFILVGGS